MKQPTNMTDDGLDKIILECFRIVSEVTKKNYFDDENLKKTDSQ
ncbi:MAG: hypothetical protein ACFFD1_07770 [Candidatus Thorarchaeota archaeon]